MAPLKAWTVLVPAILAASALPTLSHEGATGIVLERMEAMKDVGRAAKSIKGMAEGKQAFDASAVEGLATRIAEHADNIPALFPNRDDSRNGAETRALPAIWEDWFDFEEIAREMADSSRALGAAAEQGNQELVSTKLVELGQSCRSCHDKFRSRRK